ncbi:hypothetical protein D3C77_749520 [compost metagenome]
MTVVPHGQQVLGITEQEIARHSHRQRAQNNGRHPRFTGHGTQLPGALLALADQFDQVLQQFTGVATVAMIDAQTQGEQP